MGIAKKLVDCIYKQQGIGKRTKTKLYLTLSHSFCSSVIAEGDSMSGRMLNAWPSFIYAGPKEVTISRNSIARATSF